MKKHTIITYSFDELSDDAKERAISDYIDFLMEVMDYENCSECLKKAVDKANDMKTPWFTGGYIYDYCKDELINDLRLDYQFYSNGEIYNRSGEE